MLCKNPCLWVMAGLLALAALTEVLFAGGGGAGSSSSAPDTNYSAILEGDLPDGAKKPFITYQDNAGDQSALQTALKSLAPDAAGALQSGKALQVYSNTSGYGGVASSLTGALGLGNPTLQGGNMPGGAMNALVNNPAANAGQTVKYGVLFAAPASLGNGAALQQVADRADLILESLPESNAPATPAYNYRYVISTSVADASAPAASGSPAPATYILVTFTRIPTAAGTASTSAAASAA